MTAPVHFIELYADRGEITRRLVCTATPDAPCRRRPVGPDAETWTDDAETTPGHECWATEWVDAAGFSDAVRWGKLGATETIARVPVRVFYDEGVVAEPAVLPDPADLFPVTADSTQITSVAGLGALPVGSVILDRHAKAWQRTSPFAWTPADSLRLHRRKDEFVLPGSLPALVLHRPDAPQPATTADAVERAARDRQEAEWAESLVEYNAQGWTTAPDDYDRMFWEAGYSRGIRAALAAARAGEAEGEDERCCSGDASQPDGHHLACPYVHPRAAGAGAEVGATHPAHWERHGHPGEPCPPYGCGGGAQYGAQVDREALVQSVLAHVPVVSVYSGLIVGCRCMDRVFVRGHETWAEHVAAALAVWTAAVPSEEDR